MTYTVSGGTLNPTHSFIHLIAQEPCGSIAVGNFFA